MTYGELQKEIGNYSGALIVERVISGSRLRSIEKLLRVVILVFLLAWLILFIGSHVSFVETHTPSFYAWANGWYLLSRSFLFLFLGIWLSVALLYGFFASFYFKDAETTLPEFPAQKRPHIRYEVARALEANTGDGTVDFLSSRYGMSSMFRLGIESGELLRFLKERVAVSSASLDCKDSEDVELGALGEAMLRNDEGLHKFLSSKGVERDDFIGAASWVSRIERRWKEHLRFWSRDALGRIPGIGKDWAYGETASLERYAVLMTDHPAFASAEGMTFGTREAEEVERILSRAHEANVLIVGDEGVPKLAILARVARRISAGTILPPLEHKRMFVFDGALFVSAMKEKAILEYELTRLLNEAVRAGNIIFVFDHFDTFLEGAKVLNSDILTVLDPYLGSRSIQIAAIVETGRFHQLLEPNPKIRERFERVLLEGEGSNSALPDLLDAALRIESEEGVLFTYGAVRSVAESAERYFPEGVMPDKAIDLLEELAPKVKSVGKRIIKKEDVFDLVSRKTGIATGEATGDERTKLLRLEEILHERIVGQDAAVSAIAGAMRRARAGIQNPNRPIGSFLFLGPTGVGKTETTKALAQVFFGGEKDIMRFDMSEYQTPDALDRLIGTFGSGKVGVLATTLREKPYGVLLLDEFEKTNHDIHDLFLQILDEGFFTDASGKRVNARNLMIIATSNAGSDLIWNTIRGTDAEKNNGTDAEKIRTLDKDVIITEIINRGIFKPEFLNRFDGVILFHPLLPEHLRVIAKLQLQKLAKRLEEKGLELVINEALINQVVSVGQDQKFGARPMNRAIQEKVEQKIAEKMLRGEISAGSRVELSPADLVL